VNEGISRRLRAFRKQKGWSQKHLAQLLGYNTHNPVALMEKGKREMKSDQLSLLANVHDLDLNWLIAGESKKPDCPKCNYYVGVKAFVKALYDAEAGGDCQPPH